MKRKKLNTPIVGLPRPRQTDKFVGKIVDTPSRDTALIVGTVTAIEKQRVVIYIGSGYELLVPLECIKLIQENKVDRIWGLKD
jgi:hypothetical protein